MFVGSFCTFAEYEPTVLNLITCTCTQTHHTIADLALTKTERKRVFNLFTALDAKHQKKLDSAEMSRMLQAIRSSLDSRKYGALLEAVSRSTYFYQDDVNKDKFIEFGEFLKAMTSVKNRDPKDFAVFLKAAKSIKPLKTGSVCRPNGSGDACPKGNTCQLTQKASGRPVYIDGIRPRQRQLQGIAMVKDLALALASMSFSLCCWSQHDRLLFHPCAFTRLIVFPCTCAWSRCHHFRPAQLQSTQIPLQKRCVRGAGGNG